MHLSDTTPYTLIVIENAVEGWGELHELVPVHVIPLTSLPADGEARRLAELISCQRELIARELNLVLRLDERQRLRVLQAQGLISLEEPHPMGTWHTFLQNGERTPPEITTLHPFKWHRNSTLIVMLCQDHVLNRSLAEDAFSWPQYDPVLDASFGELRSLLHVEPSPEAFEVISARESWDEMRLRYAREATRGWPLDLTTLRIAPYLRRRDSTHGRLTYKSFYSLAIDGCQPLDALLRALWGVQGVELCLSSCMASYSNWTRETWSILLMHPLLAGLRKFDFRVAPHDQEHVTPGILMTHLSSASWAVGLEQLSLENIYIEAGFLTRFLATNRCLTHLELHATGTDSSRLFNYLALEDEDLSSRCEVLALCQDTRMALGYKPPFFESGRTCESSNASIFQVHESFRASINYRMTFGRCDREGFEVLETWLARCERLRRLDLSWLSRSFDAFEPILVSRRLPRTLTSLKLNAQGEPGTTAMFVDAMHRWSFKLEELELAGVVLTPEVCRALSNHDFSGSTLRSLGVSVGANLLSGCDMTWLKQLCARGLEHLTLYSCHAIGIGHLEVLCLFLAKTSVKHLTCYFPVRRRSLHEEVYEHAAIERCAFERFEYMHLGELMPRSSDWVTIHLACYQDCDHCPAYS